MRTYVPLSCLLFLLFAIPSVSSAEDYSEDEEVQIRLPRARPRLRPRPRPGRRPGLRPRPGRKPKRPKAPGPKRPGCPTLKFKCGAMPKVCKNMRNAIKMGRPTKLNRITDPKRKDKNRKDSGCDAMKAKRPFSCDEYPFASTRQGGKRAVILKVPERENKVQGGQLNAFYTKYKIKNGGCFIVKV